MYFVVMDASYSLGTGLWAATTGKDILWIAVKQAAGSPRKEGFKKPPNKQIHIDWWCPIKYSANVI